MTSLPDWLVERAALDEVAPASRDRVDRADPAELAERVAALRDANAAELSSHPAGPAVAQIQARSAVARRRRGRRRLAALGLAASAAAALLLVTRLRATAADPDTTPDEVTRVKGAARLLVFRQIGEQIERLGQDAIARAGDVIQLRYNAGGERFGVIASIDGAGVVTLHYPASEDAPPEATAVAHETTTLPNAYALDDAPRFERFFFLTANDPIDVKDSLAALHALARRADSADAGLELPPSVHQWSVRLRKADRASTHEPSP